jgi:predicted ester cyclase
MSKSEDLVRRYYDAFNSRNYEAYASVFTRDCVLTAPGVSVKGVDAMRQFDRAWIESFPESRLEVLHMVTTGKLVAAAIWFHGGPQRGPLATPNGTVPPTGKSISVPGCVVFELEGDQLRAQRLLFEADLVGIQLGLS